MNVVALQGCLGNDVEIYNEGTEKAVGRFSIAIPNAFADKNGDRKVNFIPCIGFKNTIENINKFFKKGDKIAIVGSLQVSEWDDKDTGKKRSKMEVVVNNWDFCSKKSDKSSSSNKTTGKNNKTANNDPMDGFVDIPDDEDDPLPFS